MTPRAPAAATTLATAFVVLAPALGFAQRTDTPPVAPPALDASMSAEERIRALQGRPWEIHATRLREALRFDGRVDEPAWNQTEAVTDFYQRFRRDPLAATERTEVRVLYDDDNLYIGIRAFETEPGKMTVRGIFRDEQGSGDDIVIVMLDAYHVHRSAVQLNSNANGLIYDMLQTGESEQTRNINFDMVWTSRGRRTESGYEIEERIPFKSLRFAPRRPGEEVVFGVGFKRNVTRKNEEVTWPYVSIDSSWYRPAELGHIRGITDVQPGRNVELRPYVLGGATRDLGRALTDGKREVGLDVKWGVTTGLTADFTLNTDFAQEEADVQQVNFSRFSLFFPEKRQFFLEGQQMFQFGVAREADMAFTRRVGLSGSGEIVPIIGGGRLSGRQGRTSLGLMSIQTGDATGLPGQNFSIARVKRDVLSRSSLGGIVTSVQGEGGVNRVYGADASLYLRRVWFLDGFLAARDQTGASWSGAGYGRFAYLSDKWGSSYQLLSLGKAFNPGIGFVRRPDSRQHNATVRFSPRPGAAGIRQLNFSGAFDYITNQQNVLQTRNRQGAVDVDFESGASLAVTALGTLESISAPFRLTSALSIPPGEYHFNTLSTQYSTPNRRNASLSATYTTGGFWNGERDTVSLRANYRINTHLGVSGNYDVNWVDLPGGKWTSHLLSSRVIVPIRNDLAIQSLFQYNRDTRQMASNLRFRWIPKAGTDFFVVYNELDTDRPSFGAINRSLAVKLNYLFAL